MFDPATIAVMAGGQAITSGLGAYESYKNFNLQKQNLEYQKGLQNTIFQREDNAVQRRVADLRSAGLSPVLAAGSAAQAGPVIKTDAPQMDLKGLGNLSNSMQILNAQATSASIDRTRAENELLKQQANKVDSERILTNLQAQRQSMDNKIQAQYGGSSNPSPVAKIIRDVGAIGTGPVGDSVKHIQGQIQRSWNEPAPQHKKLWDRFFGK